MPYQCQEGALFDAAPAVDMTSISCSLASRFGFKTGRIASPCVDGSEGFKFLMLLELEEFLRRRTHPVPVEDQYGAGFVAHCTVPLLQSALYTQVRVG